MTTIFSDSYCLQMFAIMFKVLYLNENTGPRLGVGQKLFLSMSACTVELGSLIQGSTFGLENDKVLFFNAQPAFFRDGVELTRVANNVPVHIIIPIVVLKSPDLG